MPNGHTTEKERIVEILKECRMNAYLATVDGDQPRIRAMAPYVEDDLTIWLVTSRKTRKTGELKENPNIALQFMQFPGWNREAIVLGRTLWIDDQAVKRRIWDARRSELETYFPDGPESEEFVLYQVVINEIKWRDSALSPGYRIYRPKD